VGGVLLALLGIWAFRPIQGDLGPPPDYERIEIGMTTKEVSLIVGQAKIGELPCDREAVTSWFQAEGDNRAIGARFDRGRLVEKEWAIGSKGTPWDVELRYRFRKFADRSGLSDDLTRDADRLREARKREVEAARKEFELETKKTAERINQQVMTLLPTWP
jgi:hypothetical protein